MQFVTQVSPFLVIAPLTTLGHWVREIETWTDLNVVQYTGSGADRCVQALPAALREMWFQSPQV